MRGPDSDQTGTILLRGGAHSHRGRPLLRAGQCDKQRRMLPDAGRYGQPERLSGAEEADPDAAPRPALRGGLCPGFERLLLPDAPSERRRNALLGRAANLPGRNCAHPRQMRRGRTPAPRVPSRGAQSAVRPLRFARDGRLSGGNRAHPRQMHRDPATAAGLPSWVAQAAVWRLHSARENRVPQGDNRQSPRSVRASAPPCLRPGFCARPVGLLPAPPLAALPARLSPQPIRILRAVAKTGPGLFSGWRIQARAWPAWRRIRAMSHPEGEMK